MSTEQTEPINWDDVDEELDIREKERARKITLQGDVVEVVEDLTEWVNEKRPEHLEEIDEVKAVEAVIRRYLSGGRKDVQQFEQWLEGGEEEIDD